MALIVVTVFIVIVSMLALDMIWLGIMKTHYATWVKAVQHKPMQVRAVGAVASYAFVVLALAFVVIPAAIAHMNMNMKSKWQWQLMAKVAVRWGLVSGLAIYGVFNATNYGIFSGYPWQMAVVDTMWGGVLFGTVTFIALLVYSQNK